jgi:small-conductance mechanosensitive channel
MTGTSIGRFFVEQLATYGWAAGKVFSAVVVGLVLTGVLTRAMRQVVRRSRLHDADDVVGRLRSPARLLVVLSSLLAASSLLTSLSEQQRATFRHAVTLGIIFAAARLLVTLLCEAERYIKRRQRLDVRDNYHARRVHTQVTVLRRVIVTFVMLVCAALALMTFPRVREVGTSLLASAGIAGLVAGLAARPILENLIAGVQIALTQPINLDDVVVIDGQWGWVEEIRSTYVVVRIWDQRRLVVPLSRIIHESFENWTRRTAELLGTVTLHVDYTVPVEAVRNKLREVVDLTDKWDGRVCVLQVTDANERTLELRALVSAASSADAWDLRVFVREKLVEFLQTEYPRSLPRARLEFAQSSTADVKLSRAS